VELKLYNIYESLILESVGRNQIMDSIHLPYRVKIYYQGEDENHPSWRSIDPYVLGMSTAGNEILRAYQAFGFTTSNGASWKTFRVDRILRWEPTNFKIGNKPINEYDPTIPAYKNDGSDQKMVNISAWRKFGDQVKDIETQKQVNAFNDTKGNVTPTKEPITPAKPIAQPTTEPKIQPKVEPKAQINKKIEPEINKEPLPIKKQPNITAEPDEEADIDKKIE
jgi:hypothetical protein